MIRSQEHGSKLQCESIKSRHYTCPTCHKNLSLSSWAARVTHAKRCRAHVAPSSSIPLRAQPIKPAMLDADQRCGAEGPTSFGSRAATHTSRLPEDPDAVLCLEDNFLTSPQALPHALTVPPAGMARSTKFPPQHPCHNSRSPPITEAHCSVVEPAPSQVLAAESQAPSGGVAWGGASCGARAPGGLRQGQVGVVRGRWDVRRKVCAVPKSMDEAVPAVADPPRTVLDWLQRLGLGKYAERLEAAGVTQPDQMTGLTETSLVGMSVPLGPRRIMLAAGAALRRWRGEGEYSAAQPGGTQPLSLHQTAKFSGPSIRTHLLC